MLCQELSEKISELWRERFPEYSPQSTLVRHFTGPSGPWFTIFFHPSRRRLSQRQSVQPTADSGCPLDDLFSKASLPFRNWGVTPNLFPVKQDHILLVHGEHKAQPTAEDLIDGLVFSETTGYSLLLNLSGSGASVPDHLHWQGLRVKFPIFDKHWAPKTAILDNRDLCVRVLDEPWRGIRIDVRSDAGRRSIAEALAQWSGPFNLVVEHNKICFIPRDKEFSSVYPKSKFGGAEVAGIMYAKSESMFETVNKVDILTALDDVLRSRQEIQMVGEELVKKL